MTSSFTNTVQGPFIYWDAKKNTSYSIYFEDYNGIEIKIRNFATKEYQLWTGGYKEIGAHELLVNLGSHETEEEIDVALAVTWKFSTCNVDLNFPDENGKVPWRRDRTSEKMVQFDKELIPGFPLKLYSEWHSNTNHPKRIN